jgi:hypothetical protein
LHFGAEGGNKDVSKKFIQEGNVAMTLGARAGLKTKKMELTVNYNRIFDNGRYLMPREWGRDPFFTFMPRERNEGNGDVHAVVGKFSYHFPKPRVKLAFAAGYFKMPDVRNFALNKYGLPSYGQMNLDVRYAFGGIFKGLDVQLLVVGKLNMGETYGELKYEFNRVNLMLYNLVLNYHF